MAFRSILMGALIVAATGVVGAQAQSPWPSAGQQQQRATPWPGAAPQQAMPFPQAGQQPPSFGQQQKPPCFDEFMPLREAADKRFQAVQTGVAKHGSAAELCTLLTRFSQSEAAVIKFVQQNAAKCQFPPVMLENVKANSPRTEEYRKQACTAAARPARSAEPTLSDALSPPAVGKNNTKTGGGTLDSLFGNPLAR
jgi:hypothetical protein